MKSSKLLALSAISLLAFSACQKPELESELTSGVTHTVTFVAGAPETKTTVDISDGESAKFAWTSEDVYRIKLYENSTPAELTQGTLTDGIMTIEAVFTDGVSTGENTYVAVLNSANDLQILYKEAYTEDADILVSKAISSFDENKSVQLQFKREVAIAKMTLKGLDAGEVVNQVTVSSTADIAGSYGVDGWNSTKTSLDIYSAKALDDQETYSIVANEAGEAVVWFTCIPQDAATLTVKVEAADGDTYTKEFSKSITLTRGDVKGFGVAMTKDVVAKPWEAVELADIDETMPVVITMATTDKTYALSLTGTDDNALGTSKAPKAIEVSVVGGKLSEEPGSDILWNIANINGNLTIYPNGVTDKWLYTTNANDGVRLGTNTSNGYVWSIDAESGYLKANATSSSVRYLGVYVTGPDWRAYTNTTGNTAGQTLRFYSNASTKAAIATPTNLTVSDDKVVSWDAVDGAASYVLTIGTEEYPCTSNSYDASAIEDEYYDVAVIAVPTDTENYKNSAAATITDAKFGTPTLPTPTISAGVLEETSVAFSWTKDARATNGYHWALYNGETLVKEADETSATAAEVTGLVFGTTYTAKVYALAVDGEKPYVQSATATLDLKTKAKTTISTIVNAGTGTTTYAIADLTVMAVSGSNFVVKDETGLMFCYKSGATSGDVVTLEGTFEAYQGLKEFKPTVYTKTSTATVDHGTATELNSSNVAAYVKNPVVQYVKAKATVASDGSLKVGDVALYQYGNSLASYAGRTINLYGYTLGYNTERSNIVLLQTSVEIDQTVPYLAVEPTSKTWSSDETTAAVFNVTTNTEGVKDWAVTPNTLDWATIAVDEANGTITVTPKDKNTTDTAREATLTVTHANLSETITLIQRGTGSTAPASITINSSTENFPSSYGTANTFSEYTLNGLKYMIQQVYVTGEKLQWRASGNKNGTGTMYNSEEMPAGIASIVITFNSSDSNKNHTVKIGNSANPTSATSITPTMTDNIYTYTCDGSSKYFVITNGTGAGYIDSIVINFE